MATSEITHLECLASRVRGFSDHSYLSAVCGNAFHAAGLFPVRASAMKELSGHFPGKPILPAVLLLEAVFHVAAAKMINDMEFMDIVMVQHAKFRRPVVDGEDVLLSVSRHDTDTSKSNVTACKAEARIMEQSVECIASARNAGTLVADFTFSYRVPTGGAAQ